MVSWKSNSRVLDPKSNFLVSIDERKERGGGEVGVGGVGRGGRGRAGACGCLVGQPRLPLPRRSRVSD